MVVVGFAGVWRGLFEPETSSGTFQSTLAEMNTMAEMDATETTTGGGENERPRDDEIQAFHNQIRAQDAEKLEFVGEKVLFLATLLVANVYVDGFSWGCRILRNSWLGFGN